MVVSPTIYDGGITNVSKDDVKRIYNGNITNWKDLGGPDRQILVVSRELGSGTRDSFNEIVIGMAKAETPGVNTVLGSSAEIKTTIANSNNAIGYLGYSYVKSGGVRAVAYDGVMPTIENIKSRKYPLARSLYMYTFGEPGPGAKVYIDFVQSPDGQKIAEENGFISI
jgi:phosphate transport system substrate-binding protein